MFSTLKITTKHEMSTETLWPPWGWSFSITVETKMVTFITADCGTGSMANADVRKQAMNQQSFASVAPAQGCQQESTQLSQDTLLHCQQKRETFPCVVCHWTPDQARETTQQMTNTQCPCSPWSTLTRSCQEDRKDRKLQTNNPSNPDKWMENRNKEQN